MPVGKSVPRPRYDLGKQEGVVSALWDFADDIQHRPEQGRVITLARTGTKVSEEHIGRVLKRILEIFNLEVQEVQ
jgi:hypothetical protein